MLTITNTQNQFLGSNAHQKKSRKTECMGVVMGGKPLSSQQPDGKKTFFDDSPLGQILYEE